MKYIHILRSSKGIPYVIKFIREKKNAEHIILPILKIDFKNTEVEGKITVVSEDLDSISEKIADELIKRKSKIIVW